MTPGQAIREIERRLGPGETVVKWGDASFAGQRSAPKPQLLRGAAAVTERRLLFIGGEVGSPVELAIERADIIAVHSYWEHNQPHSVVEVRGGSEQVIYGLSTSVRGALNKAVPIGDAARPPTPPSRPRPRAEPQPVREARAQPAIGRPLPQSAPSATSGAQSNSSPRPDSGPPPNSGAQAPARPQPHSRPRPEAAADKARPRSFGG